MSARVSKLLGEPEIDYVDQISFFGEAHQEIIGLYVSMYEVLRVDVLDAADGLIGEQQDCFEAEFARAKVKQVLEARPEQIHDHDVVVAFAAAPFERGYADAALHNPVYFALDVELRVLGLGAFELDGYFFVCGYVVAHVNVAEGAASDFAAETELLTNS